MVRYLATADIALTAVADRGGQPRRVKAGEDVTGLLPPHKLEWLARLGQVKAVRVEAPAAPAGGRKKR